MENAVLHRKWHSHRGCGGRISRSKAIYENGIEVCAVVSRVKEIQKEDSFQRRSADCGYCVSYASRSGDKAEAGPGNPPRFIAEGTALRAEHLPEKPKYALMVKII